MYIQPYRPYLQVNSGVNYLQFPMVQMRINILISKPSAINIPTFFVNPRLTNNLFSFANFFFYKYN